MIGPQELWKMNSFNKCAKKYKLKEVFLSEKKTNLT